MHILFVNPRLRRNRSEASIWAKRLIEDLRSTPATVTALPDYSDNGDSAPAVTNKLGDKMKQATVQHLPEALISLLLEFKLFSRALRSMVWCSKLIRAEGSGAPTGNSNLLKCGPYRRWFNWQPTTRGTQGSYWDARSRLK